ncbi:MAG TPA: hypothetical protein VHC69_09245 [Polyangiaceae bacterium]|nr:hypothetical protein [Polyangiaceae bacterium]
MCRLHCCDLLGTESWDDEMTEVVRLERHGGCRSIRRVDLVPPEGAAQGAYGRDEDVPDLIPCFGSVDGLDGVFDTGFAQRSCDCPRATSAGFDVETQAGKVSNVRDESGALFRQNQDLHRFLAQVLLLKEFVQGDVSKEILWYRQRRTTTHSPFVPEVEWLLRSSLDDDVPEGATDPVATENGRARRLSCTRNGKRFARSFEIVVELRAEVLE